MNKIIHRGMKEDSTGWVSYITVETISGWRIDISVGAVEYDPTITVTDEIIQDLGLVERD